MEASSDTQITWRFYFLLFSFQFPLSTFIVPPEQQHHAERRGLATTVYEPLLRAPAYKQLIDLFVPSFKPAPSFASSPTTRISQAAMAHTSAHFAIVLAVLLSLSCSAIAGRRGLIASGASSVRRYQASSTLASSNRALTGSCALRADVSSTYQSFTFTSSVAGIPIGKSATVTAAGFYRLSTGALVKAIPCTAKADTATGTWSCNANGGAQLTSAYVPINPIEPLKSAGVFTSPSSFYFSVNVDGVEVKGNVVASVGQYYLQ
ncbi:unnamed protein product [Closterium sp. NIES-53]